MNKKSSIGQIALFLMSVGVEVYSFYEFIQDSQLFGVIEPMVGLFIGYFLLLAVVAWKFLEMNQEIESLKSTFPVIVLERHGKDNMITNINRYGASSLLCKNLHSERTLLYLDLINSPKTRVNNPAVGVFVSLKYFDDEKNYIGKRHYARWMERQEKSLGIEHIKANIPSDGETSERFGIGYYDKHGNGDLILLNAEVTDLSENGTMMLDDILYLGKGKYFVIVNIYGANIPDVSPLLFRFEVGKDKILDFEQEKEVDGFLKEISERESRKVSPWPALS